MNNSKLEIVRSFFTDSEWDAIDSALADYQDYGDNEADLHDFHVVDNRSFVD